MKYKEHLFNWVIMDDQPFTVVKDPHFRSLFKLCNPEAGPVSADTIRNMVNDEFLRMEKQIMHMLQVKVVAYIFTYLSLTILQI